MRRLTIVLALISGLMLVAPMANAQQKPASVRWGAQQTAVNAQLQGMAADMEAQGWQSMVSAPTVISRGYWSGRRGWHNNANGRDYYMQIGIGVDHDTTNGKWRPFIDLGCTRWYGSTRADQRCNFWVSHWHAMIGSNTTSITSAGSQGIDVNCQYFTSKAGLWRTYGSSYPWGQSYADNYQVRFVTEACAHIHLTNFYDVGSRIVNFQTLSEAFNDFSGPSPDAGWGPIPR